MDRTGRSREANAPSSGAPRAPREPYIRDVGVDPESERVRLAELVAALSLGIDLGFGQPMEHVLRQCRIALRIAELAGLDEQTRSAIYYSALLVNVGCHSDAHEQAYWFGDDIALKASKYDAEPFTAADMLGHAPDARARAAHRCTGCGSASTSCCPVARSWTG